MDHGGGRRVECHDRVRDTSRSAAPAYNATGLGAYITNASNANNFSKLTAAVIVMAVVVVAINRILWKRLQNLANDRCRFMT